MNVSTFIELTSVAGKGMIRISVMFLKVSKFLPLSSSMKVFFGLLRPRESRGAFGKIETESISGIGTAGIDSSGAVDF